MWITLSVSPTADSSLFRKHTVPCFSCYKCNFSKIAPSTGLVLRKTGKLLQSGPAPEAVSTGAAEKLDKGGDEGSMDLLHEVMQQEKAGQEALEEARAEAEATLANARRAGEERLLQAREEAKKAVAERREAAQADLHRQLHALEEEYDRQVAELNALAAQRLEDTAAWLARKVLGS